MKIKYLTELEENRSIFPIPLGHNKLKGCSNLELERLVRFFDCHLPIAYLELMHLGGYNFFEMVNAPAYLSGYLNLKVLQEQLKNLLVNYNVFKGQEIALCCQDDYFWFISSDEGDDPPIRYYSEITENIEIKYNSISEMVKDMILQYRKFYNIQS